MNLKSKFNNLTFIISTKIDTHLLTFAVISILILIPSYLFSRLRITDGFLFQVIAYVQLTLRSDHLKSFIAGGYSFNFVEYLPGYPLILSILSRLGGITPKELQFLPLAALFVPLGYYTISKRLFHSNGIAILFALYGAYDIGLVSHYNVFVYPWSNLLYFGYLIFYLRWIDRKQLEDLIIVMILFIGSLFLHYASTAWIIIHSISANLVLIAINCYSLRKTGANYHRRGSLALPTAFLVAFMTFNQMFYKVWLPSASSFTQKSASPFELLNSKIISYLYGSAESVEPYRFMNTWGQAFGIWRSIEYSFVFLPILVWILKIFLFALRRKPVFKDLDRNLLFVLPLFITALIDWGAYGVHSGFNFRYSLLVFPFISVMALNEIGLSRFIQKAFLAGLCLVTIITYLLGLKHYTTNPPTSYSETMAGSNWLLGQRLSGPILSDLDTLGQFLVAASESTAIFPRTLTYDAITYQSVVENTGVEDNRSEYELVLIDAKNLSKPLHGISNKYFEPLSLHVSSITGNDGLTKIYDDGRLWIFIR